MRPNLCGDIESFSWKPQSSACLRGKFSAAFTVTGSSALHFRYSFTNCGFCDDNLRLAVVIGLRVGDGFLNRSQIVTVDGDRIPAL